MANVVAPPGQEFVFRTSPTTVVGIARTLSEFASIVEKVEAASIAYHLRSDCNDFAAWVAGSLKNDSLAKRIKAAKNASSPEAMRSIILAALKEPIQPAPRKRTF